MLSRRRGCGGGAVLRKAVLLWLLLPGRRLWPPPGSERSASRGARTRSPPAPYARLNSSKCGGADARPSEECLESSVAPRRPASYCLRSRHTALSYNLIGRAVRVASFLEQSPGAAGQKGTKHAEQAPTESEHAPPRGLVTPVLLSQAEHGVTVAGAERQGCPRAEGVGSPTPAPPCCPSALCGGGTLALHRLTRVPRGDVAEAGLPPEGVALLNARGKTAGRRQLARPRFISRHHDYCCPFAAFCCRSSRTA